MNKEILSWLESSGLDQRRAKIYLTLLMLGESRASELARQSGVSRTAIYDNIRALEDQGYVRKSTNGKSFSYQAISPQELRDRQHQQLNQLEVVLPALQMLSNSAVTGEFVQVFRGATSANHIFEDILREKPKEYCYLSNPVET
jgi:HTH-type transcriptional regulator, sugar sensing transcriptional regulator